MFYILVVSDGTGRTATQALNAALTQFPDIETEVIIYRDVRKIEQIDEIVKYAAKIKAIIVHTLVSDENHSFLIKRTRSYNVETIDIMGPFLLRLSHHFKNVTPSEQPGLYHKLNEDYFRRIETMEYAFKHDDGMRTHELDKADIVILGVSRTFKTPLSIYLATKGWFVANIPVVLDIPLPESVYTIEPGKVFCLMTDARHLSLLRNYRHEHLGGNTGNYADFSYVSAELKYARSLFLQHPKWTIINVTSKSIEEIASEIISLKRE